VSKFTLTTKKYKPFQILNFGYNQLSLKLLDSFEKLELRAADMTQHEDSPPQMGSSYLVDALEFQMLQGG